jgi:multidrug efflux pump subunit AcrB
MTIEPNIVVVTRIALPGASAEQVEREAAIPLERALQALAGVKAVWSQSTEGKLTVEVRFAESAGKHQLAKVEDSVGEFTSSAAIAIEEPVYSLESPSLESRQH